MNISEVMLDAGIRKATEAGLLARDATDSEKAFNRALIRAVLEAALGEQHGGNSSCAAQSALRARDRWSFFSSK
ncbi:hypothetical protein RY831_17470 [Noviherbaspirillum sp. CPCC 100848]|uniref:Uncharacterized protein n=1 Tax=Noviherbaspirillum album TaxID=3080276 RepID=A0ABU6JCR7_9BURK|nr:hypothetical protein [Noviherbaspirillum sp. CPCC 100848]MEC4720959.1 hypothetical protein [Noviherbaspirillum sp. CPCC 100848]